MSDTRKQLADLLDQRMLEALRDGQEVMDQKTGELVRIPPTPAMLKAVMERMKQLGADDVPVHNTPAGKLAGEVNKHLKLPGTDGQLSKPIGDFDQ
jgi:hypothetical protein